MKEGREEQGDAVARFDGFTFADPDMDEPDASGAPRTQRGTTLPLTLDAAGGARATIRDVAVSDQPQDLLAELEYRDPNGETLTAATRVALWPAKIVLGIKPDSWVATKERLKFTVVAVDLAGKPLPGVRVRTDAFKRDYFSHRRRLIGGFYAYEHGYDTTRVGELCNGVTDRLGLLDLRDAAARDGQPDPARAGGRRRRPRRRHARGRVGHRRGRPVVRRVRQRPHRPAAREEALRAGRHRALPGAHAVQGSDRAGDDRARGRARRVREDDQPQRPGARRADEGQLRAERVRVGVPRARAHRRRRADGARRSREARVQDGAGRTEGRLAGARARGEGHAGARRLQGARQGVGDDQRAPSRRQRAAQGQRGRARRGRRGPARTAAERLVEAPRRDDGAPRRRGRDGDRADAGDRQAPLRPQGDRAGRRRRPRVGARALRHAAPVARARAARRRRQRDGRDPAQRLADELPHRGRRVVGRAALRHRAGVDPRDAGPDAAVRAAAARARRRPLSRDVHRAQRRAASARRRADRARVGRGRGGARAGTAHRHARAGRGARGRVGDDRAGGRGGARLAGRRGGT